MKKIVSGRKYDTDTAIEVGSFSDRMPNDMDYVCETLYRKRGGEYFLHGEGGARSRYSTDLGDNRWGFGEAIVPLSYDAAREWAEEHLGADAYEAEFGEVPEDADGGAVLSVRVSAAAKARLDRLAARTGRPKGEIVTQALLAME